MKLLQYGFILSLFAFSTVSFAGGARTNGVPDPLEGEVGSQYVPNYIDLLPLELILHLCNYLGKEDLKNACGLSPKLDAIINTPYYKGLIGGSAILKNIKKCTKLDKLKSSIKEYIALLNLLYEQLETLESKNKLQKLLEPQISALIFESTTLMNPYSSQSKTSKMFRILELMRTIPGINDIQMKEIETFENSLFRQNHEYKTRGQPSSYKYYQNPPGMAFPVYRW